MAIIWWKKTKKKQTKALRYTPPWKLSKKFLEQLFWIWYDELSTSQILCSLLAVFLQNIGNVKQVLEYFPLS